MVRKIFSLLVLFTTMLGGILLTSGRSLTFAQETSSIDGVTLWPTYQEVVVQSGTSEKLSITIENNTARDQRIEVSFRNVYIDQNPLKGVRIQDVSDEPPASWLSSSIVGPVTVASGEAREVMLTVTVPDDVDVRGYYPIVLIKMNNESTTETLSTEAELASLIYLSVSDVQGAVAEKEVSISDFSARQSFSFTPRMDFIAEIQNTGVTHLRTRGTITVYDPSGTRQANVETFNDKFLFLLPEQTLREDISWKDETYSRIFPPVGKYRAVFELTVEDTPVQTLSKETTFYVFPLQYVGGSIILVELLAAIVYVIIRTIRKRRTII